MTIGLSVEELKAIGSFGTGKEEVGKVYGKGGDLPKVLDHAVYALRDKTIELKIANNERIAKQLAAAGIKLS